MGERIFGSQLPSPCSPRLSKKSPVPFRGTGPFLIQPGDELQAALEIATRLEPDGLGSLDVNFLTGFRVDALAGFP